MTIYSRPEGTRNPEFLVYWPLKTKNFLTYHMKRVNNVMFYDPFYDPVAWVTSRLPSSPCDGVFFYLQSRPPALFHFGSHPFLRLEDRIVSVSIFQSESCLIVESMTSRSGLCRAPIR